MANAREIENYFDKMGVPYEEIAEQTWMIHDEFEKIDNIVVSLNGPVVLFHLRLMDVTAQMPKEKLYEHLLTLNTTAMLHGAFGLENGKSVVVTDTLQSQNLDFNEFQASVDSLQLCIREYYQTLSSYLTN